MLGKIRRMCPLCWQDSVILVVTMAVVLDLGLLLQPVGADDCHAALLFVTGVLVVARSTNGYFYGMTASLIAAVVVFVFVAQDSKIEQLEQRVKALEEKEH